MGFVQRQVVFITDGGVGGLKGARPHFPEMAICRSKNSVAPGMVLSPTVVDKDCILMVNCRITSEIITLSEVSDESRSEFINLPNKNSLIDKV